MSTRAKCMLDWAVKTFGDIALIEDERAIRFVEEAIEAAHSFGVDESVLHSIVERVSSRPLGDPKRELGQCLVTLEMLAEVSDISLDSEADREWHRVLSIPKAEWTKRHAAKVSLGIARPQEAKDV